MTIAIADDHTLLRNGLVQLVESLGFSVLFHVDNGEDLLHQMEDGKVPNMVLTDINMPRRNGYEVVSYINKCFTHVKVLVLSMYDDEDAIIKMLRLGACGYVLKDSEPDELKFAIESVFKKGFYYSDLFSQKIMDVVNTTTNKTDVYSDTLTARETEFLSHCASELTYKDIAIKMGVSPRTIDGYRDQLFEKLHIKTRVGLVLYAIKQGIVFVK